MYIEQLFEEFDRQVSDNNFTFSNESERNKCLEQFISDFVSGNPNPLVTNLHSLCGLRIAVTGTLYKYTREEIKELIIQHGGIFQSSVSRRTDLLIKGMNPGNTKLCDAYDYGIKVVDESDFYNEFYIC